MILGKYLQAMEGRQITANDGESFLTVAQLRRIHRAHLGCLVVTHHRNGRLHQAEVRIAGTGAYLFTIQYASNY